MAETPRPAPSEAPLDLTRPAPRPQWDAISRIVDAALALPAESRGALVERECGDDLPLRHEVERLLVSCERAAQAPGFLTEPASTFAAPVMEDLAAQSEAAEAASLAALSDALAGRYFVEREIGRGGTATVYLARDVASRAAVAIKLLRPELVESTAANRFLREIRVVSRLQHARIVPVIEAGNQNGLLYFILPYMAEGTLRQRLAREKRLPVIDAIDIAVAIAEALEHAHRHGLIHRDVKPENILFAGTEAYLSDFGIARALERATDDPSTSTSVVRGTVPYMSPEQASGDRQYDGRTDIYSLGCVLYEMLAGVPAYIGPSPDQVLAQKLTHPPRDIEVFRPNVPAGLSAIISKALQIAPADRFRTAAELAAALRSVRVDDPPIVASTVRPPFTRQRLTRRRVASLAGVAIALGVVAAIARFAGRAPAIPAAVAADTTIIAVLPLERHDAGIPRPLDDDLLHEALSQWRGIKLADRFHIADATRRLGSIRSAADADSVSRAVGAGRYIRGSIRFDNGSWSVYAAVYDVGASSALYQTSERVPWDAASASVAYRRLAHALLLRGAALDTTIAPSGTQSLPALQAVRRAQRALDEWDLVAADSAFESAIQYDYSLAQANLWLAQVRAWRDMPAETWSPLADRAMQYATSLSARESALAEALAHLGRARYELACAAYERLRRQNDRDFAAWFGLGMCRWLDRTVVPDSSSITGWRFRSSYHRAVLAYTRAFEILPAVHKGYEHGAFEGLLKVLLLSTTDVISGRSLRDSALFHARPAWIAEGDSLVLVPYPWNRMFTGVGSATPRGFAEAQVHQRSRLRRIAAGWSAAYPRSPGAKQAVAIALELMGDPAAADTLHLARLLATDARRQVQLAASEALLRAKFALPNDSAQLRGARRLIDSLLSRGEASATEAEALAPLALLTGRCGMAERLLRRAPPPALPVTIVPHLLVEAQALSGRVALDCRNDGTGMTTRELADAIARANTGVDADTRRWIDQVLLFRPALLSPSLDSVVIDRLSSPTDNKLLQGARALTRHDRQGARRALSEFRSAWRVERGPPTSDIVYAGARILVSIGDTATAIEWLDQTLSGLRSYDPRNLADPVRAATLARAMALRAELASVTHDGASARRWGWAVSELWTNADPELQPLVRSMSRYASLR